jgi:hypothetical protein
MFLFIGVWEEVGIAEGNLIQGFWAGV